MINKLKYLLISTNAFIINFISVYGVNYRNFISDMTYKKLFRDK